MRDYLGELLSAVNWVLFRLFVGYVRYSVEYVHTTHFFYPLLCDDKPAQIECGDNNV